MKITQKLNHCSLAQTGIANAEVGDTQQAIISLANFDYLSAGFEDVSAAASTTAVVTVKVGFVKEGPFFSVPSGCIGTGGAATMSAAAPLAGPIDVRAFAYAALVITTAEASKYANLTITAKGQTE